MVHAQLHSIYSLKSREVIKVTESNNLSSEMDLVTLVCLYQLHFEKIIEQIGFGDCAMS